MAQSNTGKNRGLDATILTGDYISLHTADPGTTGTSECTGGSYGRQSASGKFGAASAGQKQNSGAITYTGMPAATVTHFGVWDAVSGGNFIWGGSLSASKVVGAGDTVNFAISQITASYT
jgi:hypothetical protein